MAGGVVVGVDVIRLWALRIWPFPATCTIRSYDIRDDSVSAVNVVGWDEVNVVGWNDLSIAGTRRTCQGETAATGGVTA